MPEEFLDEPFTVSEAADFISTKNAISQNNAVIAVNRFGLGAKPNELTHAEKDPQAFLINQLVIPKFLPTQYSSDSIMQLLADYQKQKQRDRKAVETSTVGINIPIETANSMSIDTSMANSDATDNVKAAPLKPKNKPPFRKAFIELTTSSLQSAIDSPNSLNWRLLQFFSNHFSVTAQGPFMTGLAPTLEREAIAPNLLGSFEDMLLAVTAHPAMIKYLNNEKSFGANSKLGRRGKGLNENLAREILELHSLGVNSGYSQTDVIELAKGISGWSIANPKRDKQTGFMFRSNGHESGTRKLLGKQYPQSGIEQGQTMLVDIARHPQTAKHLCYKLAKHFIADKPSASLQNQLVKTWIRTNGNIKQVMITMISSTEAWQPIRQKFKTPTEFVISAYRAFDISVPKGRKMIQLLTELGQQPFKANSPAGFSDDEKDWNGANALMTKINWSVRLAERQRKQMAADLIVNTFGQTMTESSYKTITRAESRDQALALLLLSPEFLRR
ncbi:DUF1800 domain-containing protein [Shewanella electrodiphila]|uniref:DUF1800 domain-containing protein n=1 Tax=Shewanella electrodiphila TaxID=934143 RepID=A0ABT0KSH3_9GAMM|nr:DUF1800 domain-containing protein [Shewanella electrodiphila]MCL1046810.1 DUF1800 domain-containing protein [Shewanella electrodiphila]